MNLQEQYDAYSEKWPFFCRTCGAKGMVEVTDSVPYGMGNVSMVSWLPCPECLEEGFCPRCGEEIDASVDEPECSICGWRFDEEEDAAPCTEEELGESKYYEEDRDVSDFND